MDFRSTINTKIEFLFCIVLAYSYLCPPKREKERYEDDKICIAICDDKSGNDSKCTEGDSV